MCYLLLHALDAVADAAVNVLRGPCHVVVGGLVHALHGALNGRRDVGADGVLHGRRDVALSDVLPPGCPAGSVTGHGLLSTGSEHHVDGGKGTDASDAKREDLGGLGSGNADGHDEGLSCGVEIDGFDKRKKKKEEFLLKETLVMETWLWLCVCSRI